eukprot:JP448520.1.p3 GENE.JP448520.1~~JP448520.1.p3  ORF type:complete len:52 (+),score=6.05 JP448520.1:248-403(+)
MSDADVSASFVELVLEGKLGIQDSKNVEINKKRTAEVAARPSQIYDFLTNC